MQTYLDQHFRLALSLQVISTFADILGIAIAVAAVVGFYLKRKEIALLFQALAQNRLNQRASQLKRTLGRFESLNYDEREHRQEIKALLGELCGILDGFISDYPTLVEVSTELSALHTSKVRLTEGVKRRLTHKLNNLLDDVTNTQQTKTLAKSKT